MPDRLRKLYIDMPVWKGGVKEDDFLVAIGQKQSNSVYHVASAVKKPIKGNTRMFRFHVEVYRSQLLTALQREESQELHPVTWYSKSNKTKQI